MGPGEAAEAVGVGRSTVFGWKKDDPEFAAKWEEAVETALDKLEGRLYDLGMEGDRGAITDTLRARRPEVWRDNKSEDRVPGTQNNFIFNVTMQEHIARLERLGLPVPVIETDYEVFDDEPKAD